MDIKNAPDKYGETVGIENFDISSVEESVMFLMSGAVPYEFRTTVVKALHKPVLVPIEFY
jgi:pyruvate formate lyase activating enzyme